MKFKEHKKIQHVNLQIVESVKGENCSQQHYVRVFAVNIIFTEVSFKQSIFEQCYFRNCTFVRCDFIGAEFQSCNLRGAKFDGCTFNYSTWNSTILEQRFLSECLPSEENLARDLVQELRVNFSEIGNYPAVNAASSIEVKLSGTHLYKAAFSKESYYRSKYKGFDRAWMALKYIGWKFLDLLWGNGESISKVLISASIFLLMLSIFNSFLNDPSLCILSKDDLV